MARLKASACFLAALLVLVGQGAHALLLQRPEQDCINPSVAKINEFNFFPNDFRSIITSQPAPPSPGATVSYHILRM